MRSFISITILILLLTCCFKEEKISQDRAIGLYRRDYYDIEEYLLIKEDSTYEYFTDKPFKKILSKGKWNFFNEYGMSEIGLYNFNYKIGVKKYLPNPYNISSPILYSHAKENIVIRMSYDDHYQDFEKVVAD